MDLTDGTLLGGRVIYRQPREGFRTGIEPVLLAASVAAQPGERVLEGGTGAGAGLLCLLARLPGAWAVGVEQDATLAGLAQANLQANGMAHGRIAQADVLTMSQPEPFDHAMANPPWHDAHSTASPVALRDTAKRANPDLLARWARALAALLRPGGSLTLIVPAASAAEAITAVSTAGCGSVALLPFWPRQTQEARLVLVRAIKASRGRSRVLPGIVLHEENGYSPIARQILWDGAPISWA